MESDFLIETLAMVAGVILSLLVEIPVVKARYDKLGNVGKRAVMGLLLVAAGGALYGLTCAGMLAVVFPNIALACDQAGVALLVRAVLFALVSNQSTYGLLFRGKPQEVPPSREYYEPQ